MNYLLLSLTARLTHTKLTFRRGLLGAGIGSLSSLLIFLPELPVLLSGMLKLLGAFLICLTAYGRKRIFRNCISFFGISFLTAGGLYAISVCTEMTGDAPPEDCGGPYGFLELQRILKNPKDPQYKEMREWCYGMRYYQKNINGINHDLRRRYLAGAWDLYFRFADMDDAWE